MKIPVQRLYLKRRVGISVVALFAGAAFLAEFATAQSPVTKPSASEIAARARAVMPRPMRVGIPGDPTGTPPTGWTCVGNCGTDTADGVVTLSPHASTKYEWVSTNGGTTGVGALPTGALGGETDGSTLATPIFSATAGTALNFYFNYVTSDGAGYADYAWAELFNSSNTPVALLFTARTESSGSIVPGAGLPAPLATLTPSSVPIIGGAPTWGPLGGYSGTCFASGCGYTGWVNSNYIISTAGNYYLKVGVVNWSDPYYDSGLAVDGVTVGGVPITPPSSVPAVNTWGLVLLGVALLLFGMKAAVRGAAA
jgi:hypothetical protein